MARIRSIHPEQFTDDQWVTCSPLARLVALGVRNEADDNGVFEWNPVKLKMRLLPADNCEMVELMEELKSTNQVLQFEQAGKQYGMIRNFTKYQKPKKPTFYHPTPQVELPTGYELHKDYKPASSPPVRHQFGNSPSDGEKGREDKDKTLSSPPTSDEVQANFYLTKKKRKLRGQQLAWFEQFWDAFDYKSGRAEAADAWLELKVTEAMREQIISAAKAEAANRPGLEAAGQTPKMAQGWLSGRRFEDDAPRKPPAAHKHNGQEVDEYSRWRQVGVQLNIHPGATETERAYIARVKNEAATQH